jgi:hypothetical protein
MCVFLCANPRTNAWLTIATARSHRDAIELSAICPVSEASTEMVEDSQGTVLNKSAVKQTPRGFVLRQSDWLQTPETEADNLLREWKHRLEVLTDAWSRLLGLVGLRW